MCYFHILTPLTIGFFSIAFYNSCCPYNEEKYSSFSYTSKLTKWLSVAWKKISPQFLLVQELMFCGKAGP
jgi:hypothetical protein